MAFLPELPAEPGRDPLPSWSTVTCPPLLDSRRRAAAISATICDSKLTGGELRFGLRSFGSSSSPLTAGWWRWRPANAVAKLSVLEFTARSGWLLLFKSQWLKNQILSIINYSFMLLFIPSLNFLNEQKCHYFYTPLFYLLQPVI